MKRNFEWRNDYLILTAIILVALFVAFAPGLIRDAQAAPSEPQATATPVAACPVWRIAGTQVIHKCVDDEAPWATCYIPVGGVMQCLVE